MTPALTDDELRAVGKVMSTAGTVPEGLLVATSISGGRSNLTFVLTDGVGRWVLRMPPRAGRTPSAHDVAREHRVTSALAAATSVPVARPVLLYPDEDLLGGPFTVVEYVDGLTIRHRSDLDAHDAPTVARLSTCLLETLAALHSVDHVAAGLELFGRPDGYAARQLRRWSGQWEHVGADEHRRQAADLVDRLNLRIPRQAAVGIVHGDFRIDNTLVTLSARAAAVAAVVDWELSTIGDPVADVAMMCAYRDPAFDLIVGEESAWTSDQLPSADRLAADYERAGGVPLVDWSQHLALAFFKIAVIAAGIDHRFRAGATSGSGFERAGDAVPRFLQLAFESVGGPE